MTLVVMSRVAVAVMRLFLFVIASVLVYERIHVRTCEQTT